MKKTKRNLAIIGIVCLVLLFLSTLFFAIFDATETQIYLKTSIAATFFFPVMLYVMTVIYKLNKNDTMDEMNNNSDSDEI